MKLYYSPGACSLSPHIALLEAGLAHDLAKVDLKAKKVEDGSDFLKVNPKGQVPTLQLDDGSILTEGPVIAPVLSDETKQFFRDRLMGKLKHVDEKLSGHDYLMGKQFSVADGYLYTMLRWADAHKFDLSALKNLMAYKTRVAARPQVQAALKSEGLA